MRYWIAKLVYVIAKKLSVTYSRFFPWGSIRRWCGKYLLGYCGKNVNIEKGASFSHNVELGSNSGIGINANIAPWVKIGDNVMMGPECIIYTINHEFVDTEKPMCQQGFQQTKRLRYVMMYGLAEEL